MTRNAVQFIRSGHRVRITEFVPRTTLLDWLRLEDRAIGTKPTGKKPNPSSSSSLGIKKGR